VHTHTYAYTGTHTQLWWQRFFRTWCVCVCMCVCLYLCVCVCVDVCMCVFPDRSACTHVHTHTYTHTHTHTHTLIHTHTHSACDVDNIHHIAYIIWCMLYHSSYDKFGIVPNSLYRARLWGYLYTYGVATISRLLKMKRRRHPQNEET